MLRAGRSRVRFLMILDFSVYLILSVALSVGLIQPMTEMSTIRPVRKADNLTAIYEPIVYKMSEAWRFTILWASAACYSFKIFLRLL
jgi:hypothetical protein